MIQRTRVPTAWTRGSGSELLCVCFCWSTKMQQVTQCSMHSGQSACVITTTVVCVDACLAVPLTDVGELALTKNGQLCCCCILYRLHAWRKKIDVLHDSVSCGMCCALAGWTRQPWLITLSTSSCQCWIRWASAQELMSGCHTVPARALVFLFPVVHFTWVLCCVVSQVHQSCQG